MILDYYPFGLKHKGYNNQVSANANQVASKFKYNGKELNEELELDWYDYGARNYDPALGRWFNTDPYAGAYISTSPYAYSSNSPIRLFDPDGRQIGDGIELFNKFRGQIGSKRKSIQNTMSRRTARVQNRIERALRRGNKDRANSLQANLDSRNKEDQSKINLLNTMDSELDDLAASDQVYDVVSDTSTLPEGADGQTSFNTKTGAVTINVGSGTAGKAAHEFKHAHQFDIGALSFDSTGKKGGALHDLVDELEAYQRSNLFGHDVELNSLSAVSKVYTNISSKNTQIMLTTIVSEVMGNTYGDSMRNLLKAQGRSGSKPSHYFKGWKDAYNSLKKN